jgi:integrase
MLEEWVERFRQRVAVGDRSGNSLSEIERWTKPDGHLAWWYGASLFTIDRDAVEEWDLWMAQRGLGAKTRRNVMAALHSFCVWAKHRRPTFDVPDFPWPQPDEYVPRVLSLDLQRAVLAAIPEDRRGAFLALAQLGLRPNEARCARVEDWRGDDLRIHRGQKERRVGGREGGTKKRGGGKLLPVPAELRAWLDAHVPAERRLAEPTGYLFRNPGADNAAGQWSESAMKRVWQTACEAAGVRVSLYEGTKHSMATALTSAGVGDRVIATILGHSDERSVRKYARLEPEVIRSALGRIPR